MPSKVAVWKTATLSGSVALLAGLSSICLDYAFKSGIDFIDEHFNVFLLAALIGTFLCVIGLIGWGFSSTRQDCTAIGAFAFLLSVAAFVLGSLIGGTNVHGPFFLIFLPILPVSITGLLLLLVAVLRKGRDGRNP